MNKDYQIKKDIETICHLEDYTISDLAKNIGVSRCVIYSWIEKGIENKEDIEKLYSFIYDIKPNYKKIKEQFYKEELNLKDKKILFHGSKNYINGKIDINKTKNENDFGKGFYCGESLEQSAMFVAPYEESNLYILGFNDKGLKKKEYKINREWMLTIAYYRNALKEYKNSKLINKLIIDEDIDYIIAPIADNKMFEIINNFIDGTITDVQCEHCLSATNLGNQYVFKSKKAIDRLEILEKCYLVKKEKNDFLKAKQESFDINRDKVKLALKEYRNKGKYIEDILK